MRKVKNGGRSGDGEAGGGGGVGGESVTVSLETHETKPV